MTSGPACHQLSRKDARRVAARAQLLTAARPDDLVDVVRHLTLLQHDPISAVAPGADLMLWSRLGSSYDPGELRDALDEQRLMDHQGLIRPSAVDAEIDDLARWLGLPLPSSR
jgi:uncharacterized protein YcaQ